MPWTHHDDETWSADASDLGLGPDKAPGPMELPDGQHATRWDPVILPGYGLIRWDAHVDGVTYAIFND